ncbi:hypothetical protein CC78DRAFT_612854 [Lojkania enalia]|uniref:Rhodopsin domain-containing protein n=1 Tax=Lojkania enalia TaxID=147567 RepID=A0A9P4TPJ6_9PLEO|nr:hypothetical protein CC78DRAFT_612854 [Didymosphaeria enalia]
MIITGLYNQYKLITDTLPLTPDVLKKEEDLLHETQCSNADSLKYEHSTFIYQMCVDVITDAFSLSIPVVVLWNVHVRLPKKIALMSLFSVTVIVMGTSITRVSVIPTAHIQADVGWLYLWHNLEMSVTLLVSSLISFRQLYVTQSQSTSCYQRKKSSNWISTVKKYFSSTRSASHALPTSQSSQRSTWSEGNILPLKSIHVSPNVGISIASRKDLTRQ